MSKLLRDLRDSPGERRARKPEAKGENDLGPQLTILAAPAEPALTLNSPCLDLCMVNYEGPQEQRLRSKLSFKQGEANHTLPTTSKTDP